MTVINTNTAATLTANALAKNERAMSRQWSDFLRVSE